MFHATFCAVSFWEGWRRRYHGHRLVSDTGEVVAKTVRAQIETELAIIAEVGYEDLFLITWELMDRSAVGRTSAGSLAAVRLIRDAQPIGQA